MGLLKNLFGRFRVTSPNDSIPMEEVAVVGDNAESPLLHNNNGNVDMSQVDANNRAEASTSGYSMQKKAVDIEIVKANRKIRCLNTKLLDAIEDKNEEELISCLQNNASPNATCFLEQISACHAAAYGNPDALDLLLRKDAVSDRKDAYGRTPLHMAAWAGKDQAIRLLMGLPKDFINETGKKYKGKSILSHTNNKMKTAMIDVPCELLHDPAGQPIPKLADLPKSCKDSLEHKCKTYMSHVPKFNAKWTPLHVASYAANHTTTELLLSNGADVNCIDEMGQTPLDVAGAACYLKSQGVNVDNYVKTIKALKRSNGKLNTEFSIEPKCYSALHTAVKLCSIEAIEELLAAGAPVTHQNPTGNTPLHECVINCNEDLLQLLVNHSTTDNSNPSVDVKNADGNTVLHMSINFAWIPGVCIALDAGADVTLKANDGTTAIHIAALKGNVTILREVLENVYDKSIVSDQTESLEAPLLCAMRSGKLDCVRMIIQAGATLTIKFCKTSMINKLSPNLRISCDSTIKKDNQLIHAATDIGDVNILRYLLDHDKSLEKLLQTKVFIFYSKTPVEYTIWCIKNRNQKETYFTMLKFLLERTSGIEEFSPPVAASVMDVPDLCLDNKIITNVLDVVPKALEKYETDLLRMAILGLNEKMILKLLKSGADLSDNSDGTTMSLLMSYHPNATEFIDTIFDSYIYGNDLPVNDKNYMITIDYSVLIPTQIEPLERMKVLTALLDTGNRRNQKGLLVHVLVETYIYWNWKAFSWLLYVLIIACSLFVSSLSIYIVTVFYYKDITKKSADWSQFLCIPVYVFLFITILLEQSYINFNAINGKSYIFWLKLSMKFVTYTLPVFIPAFITVESCDTEWRRYFASFALGLAWMNLMLLISSTSFSGLFIQIFWKVTGQVMKILFSFSLLIFMFSFIFMVQFHNREPFDGPFSAFLKTLVMMTSEFEYEDNFKEEKSAAIHFIRLIFIAFLLLLAIVIMNLVTGVAVTDVQELVKDGTIRRLETQVHLMNELESSMRNNPIFKFLYLHKLFRSKSSPKKIEIYPSFGFLEFVPLSDPPDKTVQIRGHEIEQLMDAILDKAREQFDKASEKAVSTEQESQLKEIHKVVTSKNGELLKIKSKWQKALQVVSKRNKNKSKKSPSPTKVSSSNIAN